jgi:hypothetical protein
VATLGTTNLDVISAGRVPDRRSRRVEPCGSSDRTGGAARVTPRLACPLRWPLRARRTIRSGPRGGNGLIHELHVRGHGFIHESPRSVDGMWNTSSAGCARGSGNRTAAQARRLLGPASHARLLLVRLTDQRSEDARGLVRSTPPGRRLVRLADHWSEDRPDLGRWTPPGRRLVRLADHWSEDARDLGRWTPLDRRLVRLADQRSGTRGIWVGGRRLADHWFVWRTNGRRIGRIWPDRPSSTDSWSVRGPTPEGHG